MCERFNKNCYTSRSSGYKYRTLSTNTGERKRRDSKEDSTFDRKFKELKREITSRISNQVDEMQRTRESIKDKFDKIHSKIDSMIELQNTVLVLRDDLHVAESTLTGLIEKVDKLEAVTAGGEAYSLRSRKSSFRSTAPILEEKEICDITQNIVS